MLGTSFFSLALFENLTITAINRSIFELAISQPELDMPELLWKTYLEFEIAENEIEKVRGLYDRLLQRSSHVKVREIIRLRFEWDLHLS